MANLEGISLTAKNKVISCLSIDRMICFIILSHLITFNICHGKVPTSIQDQSPIIFDIVQMYSDCQNDSQCNSSLTSVMVKEFQPRILFYLEHM